MSRRFILGIATGFFLTTAALVWSMSPTAPLPFQSSIAPSGPRPFGAEYPTGLNSSTMTCAAASCHGSTDVLRAGGEHATWSDGDPHKKAYNVLFNPVSVRMAKLLGGPAAHKNTLCLKCHAVDAQKYDTNGEPLDDRGHLEGVSCDGCHGPSQSWLALHYRSDWKGLSDREKFDRYGFVPSRDLVARSLNCASCHVGARDREVNHDLIAAGHPRLAFEYTKYHYDPTYPKHWVETVPNPTFEIRAWYVGQLTSLRSAVDLLAARAERAGTDSKNHPWPELSESSCYSCHQNLTPVASEARSNGGSRPKYRQLGAAGWQVWYTAFMDSYPAMNRLLLDGAPEFTLIRLNDLRIEMNKANPNRKTVAMLANMATVELDAMLVQMQSTGYNSPIESPKFAALSSIVSGNVLTDYQTKVRDYDWDYLAQHTLTLSSFYHAAGGSRPGSASATWKPALVDARQAVAFPRKPDGFNSPKDFQPKSVYDAFKQLQLVIPPTR